MILTIKEKFYEVLELVIDTVPNSRKPINQGDFNARDGTDHPLWERVLGKNNLASVTEIVISY